jgi:hypothetical protein
LSPRRLLDSLLRASFAAVALLALGADLATAEPADWMPLRVGQRLTYEAHRDHSYHPESASIDRVFHSGRAVRTVRDAGKLQPGAVALEERMRLVPVGVGTPEDTFVVQVLDNAKGVVLYGSGAIAAEGGDPPVRYAPPLRMLPSDTPGESWSAGMYREGATEVELRGEVVGVGKLVEAPGCERCLQVRYSGVIRGKLPVYGGEATIESGKLVRTIWLRPGVGVVREVADVETELTLPDATKASTAHTLTLRLVESE